MNHVAIVSESQLSCEYILWQLARFEFVRILNRPMFALISLLKCIASDFYTSLWKAASMNNLIYLEIIGRCINISFVSKV
jgi:hypothetical protein